MARTKTAQVTEKTSCKKKAAKEPKPVLVGVSNAPIGPNGEYVRVCEVYRCGEQFYSVYPVSDEVRIPYLNRLLEQAAEGFSKL